VAVLSTFSIGTSSYTVYGLTTDALADANKYFAAHNDAAKWRDITDTNVKKRALISSFRALDRQVWSGAKLVPTQATEWPRTGATCRGVVQADGIPDVIANGEFELALALLKDASLMERKSTRSDVKSVGAGSASVEFFIAPRGESTRLPTIVDELVGCLLAGQASSVGIGLASGTDVESAFAAEDLDRSEPFA